MTSEVNIKLSDWVKWGDRPEVNSPGVYVLGLFDEAPATTDPTDKGIIYIGETCKSSLTKRLAKFEWSSKTGEHRHCAGRTFYKNEDCDINRLYVSYFTPETCDKEDVESAIIRYVERKLILDYALKWKELPQCNKK